ncbi:MAG: sigma 54-interacting transcriptional regulator [Desulfobacterales bacterium]
MRPLTLKNTLGVATALLVLATGVLISLLAAERYSAGLREAATTQAEHVAHKLSLDAAERILIHDLAGLQRLLEAQIASHPAVSYIFVLHEGEILSHTFEGGVPADLIEANPGAAPEGGSRVRLVSEKGERFLDLAWPIFGGRAGILRMGFSEEPLHRKVAALRLEIFLITAGILAAALCAAQLFVYRLTRPLRQLAESMGQVTEDPAVLRAVPRSQEEVVRLAAAFNDLVRRLREHAQNLESSHRELEERHLELDRANRRLELSLSISQELSTRIDLPEVCRHLLHALQEVSVCPKIALVLVEPESGEAFLAAESGITPLEEKAAEAIREAIREGHGVRFLERGKLPGEILPAAIGKARRLALLPFYHREEPLGAMAVGCPAECSCVSREIDRVQLILNQASGSLRRALRHEREHRALKARVEPSSGFAGLIGKDPRMLVIYRLIEDVAPTDTTVLILGESGTGKELVARAIHERSPRRGMPFVVINCSAYPSTLLESELFGHEKGAFTGATRRRPGRFEQAHGGTVFLDEIGEIPASAQIKLLRVLQSQKFERLGGEETLSVDVRILAATNRNLVEEVKAGRFREDLFYRLNVIPIHLPPLRDRPNDIPLLAEHFLRRFSARQNKELSGFSREAMRRLLHHRWVGNVRELENTVEHAVVLAKGKKVEVTDLPPSLADAGAKAPVEASSGKTITGHEIRLLREVLEECNWNKTEAAQRLGISRSTLYEKIKKYGILPPTLH